MNIKSTINSLGSTYNKSSLWCKILMFISLLLILIFVFKKLPNQGKESFTQRDQFIVKSSNEIYDDFYASIYDYLVFNNVKNDFEIEEIINKTHPSNKSNILDIGCGTGHHVAALKSKGFETLGIDISPSMINKSKEHFPNSKFKVADALNSSIFDPDSFTHVLCMYFTIYYFQDKTQFFNNAYKWLIPGGRLIIHIVDRDRFDPILPPGNPLMYISPQRYAKERITSTKVKFTDFSYSADFKFNNNNTATFVEKMKNDSDGKVRKNEHILYMPDAQEIIDEAQGCGFILDSKIDLLKCQYEYQYLYIFVKPN
jgi:ubiquinone/menaquinone biosynthesis C-methylase UbiE